MLSGGAGLGFFHCGVVKSLNEKELLPSVVSGASAGSIIAALVGTRTHDELLDALSAENIYETFKKNGEVGRALAKIVYLIALR